MSRKGFTLVEILIVVIILGILAAIVIPQFTQASDDARTSALASDLQTVRSAVELYKVQHLERLPGKDYTAGGAGVDEEVVDQLTSKTDLNGKVDAAGTLGPYLQKFPTNPFVATGGNEIDYTASGGGTKGWYFNRTTGAFNPDDDNHSSL